MRRFRRFCYGHIKRFHCLNLITDFLSCEIADLADYSVKGGRGDILPAAPATGADRTKMVNKARMGAKRRTIIAAIGDCVGFLTGLIPTTFRPERGGPEGRR